MPDVDLETVNRKRLEAKTFRGVYYNPRVDRFVAEMMRDGKRVGLGSYATAAEAGEAYARAKPPTVAEKRTKRAKAERHKAPRSGRPPSQPYALRVEGRSGRASQGGAFERLPPGASNAFAQALAVPPGFVAQTPMASRWSLVPLHLRAPAYVNRPPNVRGAEAERWRTLGLQAWDEFEPSALQYAQIAAYRETTLAWMALRSVTLGFVSRRDHPQAAQAEDVDVMFDALHWRAEAQRRPWPDPGPLPRTDDEVEACLRDTWRRGLMWMGYLRAQEPRTGRLEDLLATPLPENALEASLSFLSDAERALVEQWDFV